MEWIGVCLVPEMRSFLDHQGDELNVAKEELLTFYLTDTAVPDPYRHPFFTGRGRTAEQAEQAAYTVYLRAQRCTHLFTASDAMTVTCRTCGVRLRSASQGPVGDRSIPSWWRKWFH